MTAFRLLPAGVVAAALLALLPVGLPGQEPPPAQAVIDRYVEAIGGRTAAANTTATLATGTFEMPALGITGDLVTVTAADGTNATRVTIPGMGEMLNGFTDGIGWALDPMTGARLLEGVELAVARERADPRYRLRDAALYASVTTVGENAFDDEPCWEVEFVWRSGRTTTECFSKESGLMIAGVRTRDGAAGPVEIVSFAGAYERFGDLLYPTVLRQRTGGQEQVMRLIDMQHGEVDLSLLAPPPAVQALIDAGG